MMGGGGGAETMLIFFIIQDNFYNGVILPLKGGPRDFGKEVSWGKLKLKEGPKI